MGVGSQPLRDIHRISTLDCYFISFYLILFYFFSFSTPKKDVNKLSRFEILLTLGGRWKTMIYFPVMHLFLRYSPPVSTPMVECCTYHPTGINPSAFQCLPSSNSHGCGGPKPIYYSLSNFIFSRVNWRVGGLVFKCWPMSETNKRISIEWPIGFDHWQRCHAKQLSSESFVSIALFKRKDIVHPTPGRERSPSSPTAEIGPQKKAKKSQERTLELFFKFFLKSKPPSLYYFIMIIFFFKCYFLFSPPFFSCLKMRREIRSRFVERHNKSTMNVAGCSGRPDSGARNRL